MHKRDIIPALADLSQDIAGPIPVEIVEQWAKSSGSKAEHDQILSTYERSGAIVSSDSSGLSRLSQGKPLAHVMQLVHEPKQIIFQYGKAIGGEPVGVWAADNTQMFYPDSVDVNDVVNQMVAAQQSIESVLVDVGIGIHTGTVYHVGGGLYGKQADYIEDFTEDESNAKQILISPTVKKQLKAPFNNLKPYQHMFELDYSDIQVKAKRSKDRYYPAPFSRHFYDAMEGLNPESRFQMWRMRRRFARERTIVLFRIFHEEESKLLDGFLQQSYVNTIVHRELRKVRVDLVKSNGMLGIFSSAYPLEAIRFGQTLMSRSEAAGYKANVGICLGEVMEFDLDDGGRDIAGGPVNIASKLAEDTQERGVLYVEAALQKAAARAGVTTPYKKTASGVEIEAFVQSSSK